MEDKSSLIYSLEEDAPLTFDQFHLIVRSLHSYKVKQFKPDPCNRTVTVDLLYNASMKNVRAKLGSVPATVNKANPHLNPSELYDLEALRSTFGFGNNSQEEEPETPVPAKKRKYKKVP